MSKRKYRPAEIEEAEEKWKNEIVCKDYWAVSDIQDNIEDLQYVLDVLFNSEKGNNYEVDYQENQKCTRLKIICKPCSKELTSVDPFITHENGKHHKKIRQRQLNDQDPNIIGILAFQTHNKPRGIFAEGSLEDKIDNSEFSVIGMQFVYKEIIDGKETYTCQLCQRTADVYQLCTSKMFSHLTSPGHNQRYLETKYGYVKKSPKHFEEKCRSIEEYEGRLHVNITDLTPPEHQGKFSKAPRDWSRSLSRSPSSSSKTSLPKVIKEEPPECNDSKVDIVNPVKPQTSDVGVTADLSSEARFILHDVNVMQDADCQMILQEDTDMQDLLKETFWVITNKMEKYYRETGATYTEGQTTTPLSVYAEKVKHYIAKFAE